MKGLELITDNSCSEFHLGVENKLFCHRILNYGTFFFFFFFKKEILLKMIIAVHRFGICSSVWCRAKIFDLDQAAISVS